MTYEYLCTACGNEWEASQSINDPALKDCPACHQATAKRQVSGGTGFVLKGSGWYSDLYSSPKPAAAKEGADAGDSGKAKTADAAPSTGSESSKPAAKPAAGGGSTAKPSTNAD